MLVALLLAVLVILGVISFQIAELLRIVRFLSIEWQKHRDFVERVPLSEE